MLIPIPAQQDLQQLLITLEEKYIRLTALREQISYAVHEVVYSDRPGHLRLYTSLCTNLAAQLGQYMRLRRLVTLPYLADLLHKEDDGHDCRLCKGRCSVRHAARINDIREAHEELRELLEHLPRVSVALPPGSTLPTNSMLQALRTDMRTMEEILNEVLFIEESALIPMIVDLQQNIGAYE